MPELSHRPNALIAPASVTGRPADVERLNDVLEQAGQGRPLGRAETVTSNLAVLPVAADSAAVLATLKLPGNGLEDLAGLLDLDPVLNAATVSDGTARRELSAAGCTIGHADVAWTSVPVLDGPMPPRRSLADVPDGRRPVVAVLDSGVEDHPALPSYDPDDPFCVDAACYGWRPSIPVDALAPGQFGSHRGHATFIAGLIRRHAPDAKVLSMKLMSDDGQLNESSVIAAVEWLTQQIDNARFRVDVVCMAFGRPQRQGDDNPDHPFRVALEGLGGLGVRVVASAGNNRSDSPVYPAAFGTDQRLRVISVGSGSSREPDVFSNFGPWVEEWADGSDVVSTMPLTPDPQVFGNGFARWSGTSFSAAVHAAELAVRLVG